MSVSEVEFMAQQVESYLKRNIRSAWEFTIDIEGAPDELNIYARDLSYDPIAINVADYAIGSKQFSLPDSTEKNTLVVTVRDTQEKKLYNWCKEWAADIVHTDGTFGIPIKYLKKIMVYSTTDKAKDPSPDIFPDMMLTNLGAINPDRSNRTGYLEFQITLTQYKTG